MIDMIFTLFNSRTISNPLIKDSIETIQLKTRLSMSIFEVKYKSIKTLITLYWIKYLLALLSESNLQLILPSIYYPIIPYGNDKSIIEEVIRIKLFDKDELYHFNTMRV